MKNTKTITGLSLAALLALTACGDGDSDTSNGDENGATEDNTNGEEASGEVFEFEAPAAESQQGPYDEVTIQVPDELLENNPEYADNRVLDSITLRTAEADEPGKCALEADYNYSENVGDDPVSEAYGSARESDIEDVSVGTETQGGIVTEVLYHEEDAFIGAETFVDKTHYIYQAHEHPIYSELLGVDLNEDAESYETATHEVSCSGETFPIAFHTVEWEERDIESVQLSDPDADGNLSEADQALQDTGATWTSMNGSSSAFAEVEAGVDSEGNITLYAPGIDGWEYDNNGNWITR